MLRNFYLYRAYIFDLDDTLYKETDYLFSAYKQIAAYINQKYGIDAEEIFLYLQERFLECGRRNIFDKMDKHFGIEAGNIGEYLEILRSHQPSGKIPLFYEMKKLLYWLIKMKKQIFVLTNGNVQQQKNKIKHIDWAGINDINFVFANEIEPKPSPKAVELIMNENNISKRDIVLIGDSYVDRMCARNAEIDFVSVKI